MSSARDIPHTPSGRAESQSAPIRPVSDESHFEIPMVAQPESNPRLTRVGENLVQGEANASSRASTLSNLVSNPTPPAAVRDDADFFNLSESPPKVESKRARRVTSAGNRLRLPSPRRAASVPERARMGRSPSRRGCWPSADAAQHRHVPFDPAASDTANLNKLVEQVQSDGEHMAVLKAGIERLHETVEGQAALIERHEQRLGEQAAVNLRSFKEYAELKGELTQRAVRLKNNYREHPGRRARTRHGRAHH